MYSPYVTFVLASMVVTGAARSIVAKLVYQMGFERPLFLTLLYLAGQASSLVPYNLWRCHVRRRKDGVDENDEGVSESGGVDLNASTRSGRSNKNHDDLTMSQRFARQLFEDKFEDKFQSFAEERGDANDGSRKANVSEARTGEESGSESQLRASDGSSFKEPDGSEDEDESRQERAVSASFKESVPNEDVERPRRDQSNSDNAGGDAQISQPTAYSIPSTTAQQQKKSKNRKARQSNCVSYHGLPEQSRTERVVSSIPWYIKPVVPALFNLLNSAMRWASLVFVAASVAEMLISGTELVLSVVATRCVRGRRVTSVRWIGVGICTVGIVMVGLFDLMNAKTAAVDAGKDGEEVESSQRDQVIGILLILGQSVMSVIQDLSEELFMHEADFPPALLVGMEGTFGLILALIIYFPVAPLLGEHPSDVMDDFSDRKIIAVSVGWTLLVTVTGVFNIAATGVTSSMTRNVWKNLRTCLIWVIGLIIFYSTGNPDLGEEWLVPGSFYILLGFSVMLGGIYVYYGKGSRAR